MANYKQSNYDPSLNGYWKGVIDGAPNYGYPINYYFADTIRALFIGFENFFNDLHVVRYNKFGEPVKSIKVPIKFGPRAKSHDFRTEEESGKKYYISLPNLTYRLDSMQFASERAKGIYEQRAFYEADLDNAGVRGGLQDQFWSDVQPVPHNFGISMEANCEKMSDALQIMEQIGARFQPAAFFDVKEFWFFNKRRSIKLKLDSLNLTIDSESMGEEDWRKITVSFTFTMEGVLYKPIKDARIIERINTYVTMNKGNDLYHVTTFGNKDGSLTDKYDFGKIYNTKVGNVYQLAESPTTVHYYTDDGVATAHFTTYKYEKTTELTTYDADAKQLSAVYSEFVPSANPVVASAEPVSSRYENYIWNESTNQFDPIIEYTYVDDQYIDKSSLKVYSGEYHTTRYYRSMSGINEFKDDTVTFGDKPMMDEYGKIYPAYYSTFYEEGTYARDKEEQELLGTDYIYNVSAGEGGKKVHTTFEGGKYTF